MGGHWIAQLLFNRGGLFCSYSLGSREISRFYLKEIHLSTKMKVFNPPRKRLSKRCFQKNQQRAKITRQQERWGSDTMLSRAARVTHLKRAVKEAIQHTDDSRHTGGQKSKKGLRLSQRRGGGKSTGFLASFGRVRTFHPWYSFAIIPAGPAAAHRAANINIAVQLNQRTLLSPSVMRSLFQCR